MVTKIVLKKLRYGLRGCLKSSQVSKHGGGRRLGGQAVKCTYFSTVNHPLIFRLCDPCTWCRVEFGPNSEEIMSTSESESGW